MVDVAISQAAESRSALERQRQILDKSSNKLNLLPSAWHPWEFVVCPCTWEYNAEWVGE